MIMRQMQILKMKKQMLSQSKYYIIVKDGRNKTYNYRKELFNFGLRFKKTGKYIGYWRKTTSNINNLRDIQVYCKKKHLKFLSYDINKKRSSNYRKIFFANYDTVFKDYYICSYCGKLLKKEEVTVDHIIPIAKAQKNNFYRIILRKLNIININDYKNLTCSCSECNFRKSNKAGIWIVRGFLGKNAYFWVFMKLILLIVIGIELIVFINVFIKYASMI